jgi:NADH dehydrogenase
MGSVVSTANSFMGEGRAAPTLVDEGGHATLIDVARAAGIAQFVFMSATTASASSPVDFFRCKAVTEQRLAGSGLNYTIIRATAFAETYIELARTALAGGPAFPMVGRGDNPVNCITIDDVARYVVLALQEPRLRNRTLAIGGPENVTLTEFLRRIEAAAGRPVPTKRIPLPVARAVAALAAPVKPVLARMIRLGVLAATTDQRFDMAPAAAEFGLPVTPLQEAIESALRR